MSPIRDPDSPEARRMTRLGARMARPEPPRGRRERGERESDEGEERPHLSAAEALEADWDALPKRAKHGRRGVAERRRAQAAPLVAAREPAPLPAGEEPPVSPLAPDAATDVALVVATTRGPCEVELADGTRASAVLPKALARAERSEVAVGDRVELARRPNGELAVARVLARRSRLSRPDPFHPHRERVLAANLDLAVVVASVRSPPLATGLVDRFLVALAHGGVGAVLAVNKIDLVEEREGDAELAELDPYRPLGLPVVPCSARTGEGIEELRARIAGSTVAFVGHSGVGKSSLLNALAPEAGAAVGEVAVRAGRGRHTTTGARIYRLADDTRIVDTAGVREFGLWKMTPRELALYFEELAPFAAACRFTDCTHRHEPGCAVRSAAERGELSPERFATYLRILASLEAD